MNKAAEAAVARQRAAEERKAQAAAAAEARRVAAEERKAAAAEAKREAEEKRKAVAEAKRQAKEEKKAAAAAAAAAKKKEAEERRAAAAEAKRIAAEEKKAAAAAAAEERKAKAAAAAEAKKAAARAKKNAPKIKPGRRLKKAPRGVPTVVNWKVRRDGGITGKVYGSEAFREGERIETSPIETGELDNGCVVTTGSGSKYFLSADTTVVAQSRKTALKDLSTAKPGSTINLTRQRQELDRQAAKEALNKAEPRATISLFGLFGDDSDASPLTPPESVSGPKKNKKQAKKTAPRGVPTLSRWRKNRDGSITGFITGSPNFSENERVTTSPIAGGTPASGEVVRTGSGSKYFLS